MSHIKTISKTPIASESSMSQQRKPWYLAAEYVHRSDCSDSDVQVDIVILFCFFFLILFLLVLSADYCCKQFESRSGPNIMSGLIWI